MAFMYLINKDGEIEERELRYIKQKLHYSGRGYVDVYEAITKNGSRSEVCVFPDAYGKIRDKMSVVTKEQDAKLAFSILEKRLEGLLQQLDRKRNKYRKILKKLKALQNQD